MRTRVRVHEELIVVPYSLWADSFHAVKELVRDRDEGCQHWDRLHRRMQAYTRAYFEGRGFE
jgi:hypothetical protein